MKGGKLVTKLFSGAVHADIIAPEKAQHIYFHELLVPRAEETSRIPAGYREGHKLGRYRAAMQLKDFLVELGVYDRIG
jgi:hypothetical protein